jgi:hypothetical protein
MNTRTAMNESIPKFHIEHKNLGAWTLSCPGKFDDALQFSEWTRQGGGVGLLGAMSHAMWTARDTGGEIEIRVFDQTLNLNFAAGDLAKPLYGK